jgi:hypothetical protein
MLLSHYQIAGQDHDLKIANRSFQNVSQFKHAGMTVTNQNLIHEEVRRRINSGNARYHSVENFLSSRLSKNVRIKVYQTAILPVVLYWCETWSLTLREEHRLKAFENKVLRKIFGFGLAYSMNMEKRNAYRLLIGKPEAKRPLGRPRCRWVGNIKMDLGEMFRLD